MPSPSDSADDQPSASSARLQETCEFNTDAGALVQILDQYLADLKAGKARSREELIVQHPDFASQLEACLAGIEFLHGVESSPKQTPQRLGDFKILREVGRGGMGAVFEAEQVSLGRRVALKVLRFAGVSDPEAIERFQREAETVAKLHHTNIVPVFAVGSERGVNYYAMQFIEGQSLAEVSAAKNSTVGFNQVAEWGLQAAEALAHAHKRGVIHRDVKPSNLLLDNEGRLWLTDFGLARSSGDVTLSLTGALLGTPRYMSPEQAIASHKKVDHRSDIFSLGTTLYELLSGQPAFAGDTAHDVIQHILSAEPIPLRKLVPSLPRNLETIVHKCLAKDPSRRYRTSQELAEDLHAYLDDRPIRARRANLLEQASHWLKHQQRSVKLASLAIAGTLIAIATTTAAWSGYRTWQQSSLKLLTPSPPIVAEIQDKQGKTLHKETLPTQQAISLPAGDYQIRASKEGTLSQTWDITLARGIPSTPSIDLRDQTISKQVDVERTFALTNTGDQNAIILLNKQGIGLHSPTASLLEWKADFSPKSSPLLEKYPGFRWQWNSGAESYSGYETYDQRPMVAKQSIDVNGDRTADFIVAGRHQAWLMAVSGKDGHLLWFAGRGKALNFAPLPGSATYDSTYGASGTISLPLVTQDYDGDGVLDIITSFVEVDVQRGSNTNTLPNLQWAEAFSGKTGKSLWKYEIPTEHFNVPQGNDIPLEMRWHFQSPIGMMNQSGGSYASGTRHVVRQPHSVQRTGFSVYAHDLQIVQFADKPRVAILAGQTLHCIDPQNGTPLDASLDIGIRCGRSPQWVDCDDDSLPDLVLLEPVPVAGTSVPKPKVVVWSWGKRAPLWQKTLDANWPYAPDWSVPGSSWPVVSDLQGDGSPEILVPDGGSTLLVIGFSNSPSTPWGQLKVLDGKSGNERWARRLPTMDCQLNHFIVGPDVDQDGSREVFAASLVGKECVVYLDALSGTNGKTLWSSSHLLDASNLFNARVELLPLAWWHTAGSSIPQLLVHAAEVHFGGDRMHTSLCTFSAADGKLLHFGNSISEAIPSDLDHDGAEELLLFKSKSPNARDWGGSLQTIRGSGTDPWSKLAALGTAAADYDGDSVRDLITTDYRSIQATSGRTGKALWKGSLHSSLSNLELRSLAASSRKQSRSSTKADLNGDGTEDLLAWGTGSGGQMIAPFHAVSGKTGKPLWNAKQIQCQTMGTLLACEAHDFHNKNQPDVVILASLDHGYPVSKAYSSHESQLWLFVLSGKDGELRWSHPLSAPYGQTPGNWLPFQLQGIQITLEIGDLNNDGVFDILVPSLSADGQYLETVALSGDRGDLLWKRPFSSPNSFRSLSLADWIPPVISDLQGDGKVEVAVVDFVSNSTQANSSTRYERLSLLDGAVGTVLWSWQHSLEASQGSVPSAFSMAELLRPVVFQAGNKSQTLGLCVHDAQGNSLLFFDASGKPQQTPLASESFACGLWACDINNDNTEEMLLVKGNALLACETSKPDQPLWSKPVQDSSIPYTQILDIVSNSPYSSSPVIAVLNNPRDNTILGVDSASGKSVWSSPGPSRTDNDGNIQMLTQVALLGGTPTELPYTYYAYESVSRCRQVILSPQVSNDLHSLSTAISKGSPYKSREIRWQRDLPWIQPHDNITEMLQMVGWGLFFAATLLVVPGAYLLRIVTHRQYSLRTLLMLPVLVGVFLAATQTTLPQSSEFRTLSNRSLMAIANAPILLMLHQLAFSLWYREGKRLRFWICIAIAWSLLAATIGISVDLAQTPFLPEESYDLAGWYRIGLIGLYITSWNVAFALAIRFFLSLFPRRASNFIPVIHS